MPNDTYSQTTIKSDKQLMSGAYAGLSTLSELMKEYKTDYTDNMLKSGEALCRGVSTALVVLSTTTNTDQETPLSHKPISKFTIFNNKLRDKIVNINYKNLAVNLFRFVLGAVASDLFIKSVAKLSNLYF